MDSTENNHSGTGSEQRKFARIYAHSQLRQERKRWVDNLLKGLGRMPPILYEDDWLGLPEDARAVYLRVNRYRVYQHTHVGLLPVVEFVPVIRDAWGRETSDD